jgi:hypothetical protein
MLTRSRPVRERPFVTLREVLNWVAHNVFDVSEHDRLHACQLAADLHGDYEPLEYALASMEHSERAAQPEILDDLGSGEIAAEGRLSETHRGRRRKTTEWSQQEWQRHAADWSPIPPERWSAAAVEIDWDMGRLRWPDGEYVDIRVRRQQVLQLWKSESLHPASGEDVSLTAAAGSEPIILQPARPRTGGRPPVHDYTDIDRELDRLLKDRGVRFFRENRSGVILHLRRDFGQEGLPPDSTLRGHVDKFLSERLRSEVPANNRVTGATRKPPR